jgi:hypothetical protein
MKGWLLLWVLLEEGLRGTEEGGRTERHIGDRWPDESGG